MEEGIDGGQSEARSGDAKRDAAAARAWVGSFCRRRPNFGSAITSAHRVVSDDLRVLLTSLVYENILHREYRLWQQQF